MKIETMAMDPADNTNDSNLFQNLNNSSLLPT